MITAEQANNFASEWIDAWNAHDLERVIAHYAVDVDYFSPFIAKLTDNKTGMLHGRKSVKDYLAQGLAAYPDLHFKLKNIYFGVGSITLHYESVNHLMAMEVFEINTEGLVSRVLCQYDRE